MFTKTSSRKQKKIVCVLFKGINKGLCRNIHRTYNCTPLCLWGMAELLLEMFVTFLFVVTQYSAFLGTYFILRMFMIEISTFYQKNVE